MAAAASEVALSDIRPRRRVEPEPAVRVTAIEAASDDEDDEELLPTLPAGLERSDASQQQQQQRPAQQQAQQRAAAKREEEEEEYVDWEPPRLQRPRSVPRRACLTAVFLLVVGVIFGVSGLAVFFTKGLYEAGPLFIIAGIGFLPGAYHSVLLFLAWRGTPGYTYDLIPQFQD